MTDAPARSDLSEDAARRRAFLLAWACISAFMLMQVTANALSALRDLPGVDPREPFIWEYSSAAVGIALVPAVAWLLHRFPPRRDRWLVFVLVQIAGSIGYSWLHVIGFQAIRTAIYALFGEHYGGPDFLYEYRKDLVIYAVLVLVLWTADWIARLLTQRAAKVADGVTLYQLRDGARVVRVPLDQIVSVTSARNYVEFHLADGRRPLIRDTLAKVEQDLTPAGFVRTHRSWLVNPSHVREVAPAAGGDFRLELAGGLSVPLSRRFPEALEALRRPAA